MPEQDDYIYPGAEGEYPGGKVSVCNVFVCRMWKAAGLLGDLDIQCAEFTPLDNVQLKIFDENYDPPQECKTADPMNTKFCQIMGKASQVYKNMCVCRYVSLHIDEPLAILAFLTHSLYGVGKRCCYQESTDWSSLTTTTLSPLTT